jgi:hypothetical protein
VSGIAAYGLNPLDVVPIEADRYGTLLRTADLTAAHAVGEAACTAACYA